MKISEIITDKYKLRIPPTVYYELLADVQEVEEDQEPTTKTCKTCRNYGSHNGVCDICKDYNCFTEPNKSEIPNNSTTKNDLGVEEVTAIAEWTTKLTEANKSAYSQGYADGMKAQEPRWIPVSERLPKIADVYRVTRYYPNNVMNPNYLVDACFFDGSNTWYNDNRINHEREYAVNVIAWQENPEPYKAYREVEE